MTNSDLDYKENQANQPNILYHGSKLGGLKTLIPHQHSFSLPDAKVVFATNDVRFALAMIHGSGRQLAVGYYSKDSSSNLQMYIDELEEGNFQLLNKPGWIYLVDPSGFKPNQQLAHCEFIKINQQRYQDQFESTMSWIN